MHPSEFGTPGKIPPVLTGTAGVVPQPFEQWDPEGDMVAQQNGTEAQYVPTLVRVPPQLPRPEAHPRSADYAPRGYQRFFTNTPAALNNQLGFTAHCVRVDNFSSHWLFFSAAGQWVPPGVYGAVLTLNPGSDVAQYTLNPPPGRSDASTLVESTVLTVWYEVEYAPNAGALFLGSSVLNGPVTVQGGGIMPATSSAYNLGSATLLWNQIWAATIVAQTLQSYNAYYRLTENQNGGEVMLTKMTATPGNPGANIGALYFRDGTTGGTLKLVVRAGAAGAETTILDNIPT